MSDNRFKIRNGITSKDIEIISEDKTKTANITISDLGDIQFFNNDGSSLSLNIDGNLLVNTITSPVYSITGTELNPNNGTFQTLSLTADVTLTENFQSGHSITLRIESGDSFVITWPTMTWIGGSAPTLGANDIVVLWKENTNFYGAHMGELL